MKTNHQRNFCDQRSSRAVFESYVVFSDSRRLELSDKVVSASATSGDHTNGKRGIARDRKGAKKFLNSRQRFHENAALKKLVEANSEH